MFQKNFTRLYPFRINFPDMKPIIIALIAEMTCFIIFTICLRIFPTKQRAKLITGCFFAVLPLVIILHHLLTPREESVLLFSIFIYTAGFFGGLLQLYNLADRGFSLRILIDIDEAPSQQMSLDEIMTDYSQGRGIKWMYAKRIEDMKSQELMIISDGIVSNTGKGEKVANLFGRLRRLYKLPTISPASHP